MKRTSKKKRADKAAPRDRHPSDDFRRLPRLSKMSPIRQRIELRRRANAEYYAYCGMTV